MNQNRLMLLLGLLMAAVLFAACTPEDTPRDIPRPNGESPVAPLPTRNANGNGIQSFYFVIEAYDRDNLPVSRRVGITVTPYDNSGKKVVRKDSQTGEELPPIAFDSVQTPRAQQVILQDGIVGASLSVTFFGMHEGDIVACHVEKNGQMLPGTRNLSPMVKAGGSMVTVSCVYTGG